MADGYENLEPARADVDAWTGAVVLEFGVDWCPHCQAAQPLIAHALTAFPGARHVKVADGKGKPLGRSFAVKLWPTLIFLKDGQEVSRVVRPADADDVRRGLEGLTVGD